MPLMKRRQAFERLAEPEQHESGGKPDRDEEDRESPVRGISGRGCEHGHRADPTRSRATITPAPTIASSS